MTVERLLPSDRKLGCVIKSSSKWLPSVTSLQGSHTQGTVTVEQTKKYYQFELSITPSSNAWVGEIQVPDTYAGLSVEVWNGSAWELKDGASGYKLSVPYKYDYTDKLTGASYASGTDIPADWDGTGSPTLIKGTTVKGTQYRVQLAVSTATELQLKITIYYMSSSGIEFDGVNDYIRVPDSPSLSITDALRLKTFTSQIRGGLNSWLIQKGYCGEYSLKIQTSTQGRWYQGCNPSSYELKSFTISNIDGISKNWTFVRINPTHLYGYLDDTLIVDYNFTKTPCDTTTAVLIMSDAYTFLAGTIHNITVSNATQEVLSISAYSFSNGTTVTDSSGTGNHGTAYGNVQYKVNKKDGFNVTMVV